VNGSRWARFFPSVILLLVLTANSVHAGNGAGDTDSPDYNRNLDYAQVEYVKATEVTVGTWRFEVTVRHGDEGWDHYADAWHVIDAESGEILGERILAHPHDNEQPFIRSQSGIAIPTDLTRVVVRAKCNIHGFGGREIPVDLSRKSGKDYQVERLR
jgi:hypothetical protein